MEIMKYPYNVTTRKKNSSIEPKTHGPPQMQFTENGLKKGCIY